ncbi:MAG: GNAT family N-acetyltransferase [Bifidobacteriales bacterium]|nr:GNAT family N-acetyltransferase [Bifidobacteriales bacterium]
MEVVIRYDALTPELYERVRSTAGFHPYSSVDVRAALSGGYCSVVAEADGEPAGIGRVVADGRIAFFIKDLVVLPHYRHQGVGSAVLQALLDRISQDACEHAYVGLMATPGKEGFNEEYGFIRRPGPDLGSGMVRFLDGAYRSQLSTGSKSKEQES